MRGMDFKTVFASVFTHVAKVPVIVRFRYAEIAPTFREIDISLSFRMTIESC